MNLATHFLAVALISLAPAAFAADEVNVSNGLTASGSPLGMHGFDPVSMFEGLSPTIGDPDFVSEHDGVAYYFETAETQAAFEADPDAMLPQFGGFCALGVFVGKKLDGDVRFADIVDGKLYLFVNKVVFENYLKRKDEVIAGATKAWPAMRSTPVAEL